MLTETFGYTVDGGSSDDDEHQIRGSWFTIPEDGITVSITAYCSENGSNPLTRAAIYTYNDVDDAGSVVVESENVLLSGETLAWNTWTLPATLLKKNTKYFLVLWSNAASPFRIRYAAESDKGIDKSETFSPPFPSPLTGETGVNRKYSIYCSYKKANPVDGNSMRIYYSGSVYPLFYVGCWCKRWDESSYDITVETFLSSSNRNALFSNLVPGAIREFSNELGWTINLDGTYTKSGNTLILEPQSGYGLSSLRSRKMVVVKGISDTFINPNYFNVKLETKWKRTWSDYGG